MICPKCNTEIENKPRFCPECGYDLTEPESGNKEKTSKPTMQNKVKRTKGKSSTQQSGIAVLAFLFAILQLTTANMILLAITIINKDTWNSRQCSQAIMIGIFPNLVSTILRAFNIFSYIPVAGSVISSGIGIISAILAAICIVFEIIAVINVKSGKDANIPIASNLSAAWFS